MTAKDVVITPDELFRHWQGHRALTRRVIEAFPEKDLFTFSVGGMRPFAALAHELIRLAGPGLEGLVTGDWSMRPREATTRAELLARWDETTAEMDRLWPHHRGQGFVYLRALGVEPPPFWDRG